MRIKPTIITGIPSSLNFNGKLNLKFGVEFNNFNSEDKNIIATVEIFNASLLDDPWEDTDFTNKKISQILEVIDGKIKNVSWSGIDGIYNVEVNKSFASCIDAYSNFEGQLPTQEIYNLLTDWKKFLEEYYKRAFVPLEWIKPEYLEMAKKSQKPMSN